MASKLCCAACGLQGTPSTLPPGCFAGRPASLVPFALRWLQADLPERLGSPAESQELQYALLHRCQQEATSDADLAATARRWATHRLCLACSQPARGLGASDLVTGGSQQHACGWDNHMWGWRKCCKLMCGGNLDMCSQLASPQVNQLLYIPATCISCMAIIAKSYCNCPHLQPVLGTVPSELRQAPAQCPPGRHSSCCHVLSALPAGRTPPSGS